MDRTEPAPVAAALGSPAAVAHTAEPAPVAHAPGSPGPAAFLAAWPRSTQLATAFLLGAAAVLLGLQCWQALGSGSRPADLQKAFRPIDLNRAGRAELLQLPGVGPVLAERIEMHRDSLGGFRSVDDLHQVPGVGPATVERIRPWVYVADDRPAPPPQAAPLAGKPPVGNPILDPIDINQATQEDLERLPGIGPVLSQRIMAERPFRTVDDLLRVRGIGPKTLEKLRPMVCVRSEINLE